MRRLRVCLAEDDENLRATLKQMLKVLGHEVVCDVENGEELLHYATNHDLDLAVMDLDMPVMDGLATAEALQARHVPIILISGHADLKHVVTDKEPISISLTKPVSLDQLEAAIAAAVKE